jgi:predicted nucleotidyltransferase
MKPNQIRNKLNSFAADIFDETPVIFAYLYGSHATGVAHSFSDIDIGIYVPEGLTTDSLDLEMSLALAGDRVLQEKLKCDVRLMNRLPLAVAGEVVTSGILIYCSDHQARVEYETKIRMAYFDFVPFLRKYQQAYLTQMP